jgi:hypothetical protein
VLWKQTTPEASTYKTARDMVYGVLADAWWQGSRYKATFVLTRIKTLENRGIYYAASNADLKL